MTWGLVFMGSIPFEFLTCHNYFKALIFYCCCRLIFTSIMLPSCRYLDVANIHIHVCSNGQHSQRGHAPSETSLYSITKTQGILYESSSAASKPNILSDYSLWYIQHWTKMKPDTVQKEPCLDIENQSDQDRACGISVELDIFPQMELAIENDPSLILCCR